MTDSELNEAVARKLGWIKELTKAKVIYEYAGRTSPAEFYQWRRPEGMLDAMGPPDYCHSIAAAWEVVDKIKADGCRLEISSPLGEPHWVCQVYGCYGDFMYGAGADTAPMAICLAFLKLA